MDIHKYLDLKGDKCDFGISSLYETCDVYVRIYINNELDLQTRKDENKHYGTYILNCKTPKISKKSLIQIEMWDDDSGFFGSNEDLLLNKTFTIDELTKQRRIKIKAGTKIFIDK